MPVNWAAFNFKFISTRLVVYSALLLLLIGCSCSLAIANERLKLATTTSIENTGIIYELIKPFQQKTGIKVDVIAVGTGNALKLGEEGDVDVVFVHDKDAEEEFVKKGFGINRKDVMNNNFIIIGPKNDPARVKKAKTVEEAFKKIYNTKTTFISRGDDSGTDRKEKAIWKDISVNPEGSWYKEAGQGMGTVILMADNLKAYTFADSGTYFFLKDKIKLVICYKGDKNLKNFYGIIAINPANHKNVNSKAAELFINWVTSNKGQKIIRNYKKSGKQLFYPASVK